MQVGLHPSEESDLKLTAKASGYTIEIDLFNGVNKQYGTYSQNEFFATVNHTNVVLADSETGVATFSQEGDLAKFEASFIYNMDTLVLTLTGFPYTKPEDIVPADTIELHFEGATVQYKMGMNRIEATSANPKAKLFIGYMGSLISTVNVADFSYSSALTLEGEQITFLRGEMTVNADGNNKVMTAGLLGNNRVWYNIHLTTETTSTATDNISMPTTINKIIEDGQLWIVKDGVKYNVLGSLITK
jgi:hypothetical protein